MCWTFFRVPRSAPNCGSEHKYQHSCGELWATEKLKHISIRHKKAPLSGKCRREERSECGFDLSQRCVTLSVTPQRILRLGGHEDCFEDSGSRIQKGVEQVGDVIGDHSDTSFIPVAPWEGATSS